MQPDSTTSESVQERVIREFGRRFLGVAEYCVRAPGRVNLIGEHTDYNDGFVLPLAIDRAVWIALRPRSDRKVRVHSLDFDETSEFDLDEVQRGRGGWEEYLRGVAWALQAENYRLQGWEGTIAGDVPVGAGLSSSAALELAAARAFSAVSGFDWNAAIMAKIGQRAENDWVGVRCGIMDQMISAAGVAGHALLIDCRSLQTEPVPFPAGTAVVILDTTTRRGLVDSAYNERRQSCEQAARIFGVCALRDAGLGHLESLKGQLDPLTCSRARHVVTENARTLEAAAAMRRGDAVALGNLMNDSHASLRDDFQVSSDELDSMVECGRQHKSCFGIRMTGAGFGGCAVALVLSSEASSFASAVLDCYRARTELNANIYVCKATDGASVGKL